MTFHTIGHSTRSFDALLALLQAHGIQQVADIRTIPRSARHPHFSREPLAEALARARVRYRHIPALGGLRKPHRESPNTAWRNPSFRGYADYMGTDAFARGLEELLAFGSAGSTALMCAEAVWWRCHRALLADALVVRGHDVRHIVTAGEARFHALTATAVARGDRITYPGLV